MRVFILILAVAVPLADLLLLRVLLPVLGGSLLLAWIVLTALIGITITRLAGAGALHNVRIQLQHGQLPGRRTLDDGLHILGGLLLAFPGFLTDLLAVPLLFAPTRHAVTALLAASLGKRLGVREPHDEQPLYTIGPDGRPIRDVDVEVRDEPTHKNHDQAKT